MPSLTSEDLNANPTLEINPMKLDMATSGVALRETGESMLYYAVQMHTYFCTLIQVQPIKTRMSHDQDTHITAIWSVFGLACSGDKLDTLQIAMI